jgi:hypothetical protein
MNNKMQDAVSYAPQIVKVAAPPPPTRRVEYE